MLTRGFLKPKLSINKLGRYPFWTGIVIGVSVSLVLSHFLNYSREALRFLSIYNDLYIPTDHEFKLYDLFFASFSTSIGFGFTIIYWLGGQNQKIKKKYYKTFATSTSWLISIVALMIVSRIGSVLSTILYGLRGYDNHLNFLEHFWLLLALTPIYIFLAHWNTIRLIFRTKYWIIVSVFFYCLTSFYLFKVTSVDKEILNQIYNQQNQERFEFIESEFNNAYKLGIDIPDSYKEILRNRYAERTIDLTYSLKKAFNMDRAISADSLILEKILIHNMNHQDIFWHDRADENWPYAFPEDIYSQILKNEFDSINTQLLFEILYEQIVLLSEDEIDWETFDQLSRYERSKSLYKRQLIRNSPSIPNRLINVCGKLLIDNRFRKYKYLLNDFEKVNQ